MTKTVLLYRSKYGATLKYANWLTQQLGCMIVDIRKADIKQVKHAQNFIFGGGVYAGRIAGLKFLRKHTDDLKGKNIFIFAVGGSAPCATVMDELRDDNLSLDMNHIPLFYFRGQWNCRKLKKKDKAWTKLLKRVRGTEKHANLDGRWHEILSLPDTERLDWTDEGALSELVAAVKATEDSRKKV